MTPEERPKAHLVNAAAPAMLMLLERVARHELTPEEAVDVLLDWPERVALKARIQRDEVAWCGKPMSEAELDGLAGEISAKAVVREELWLCCETRTADCPDVACPAREDSR